MSAAAGITGRLAAHGEGVSTDLDISWEAFVLGGLGFGQLVEEQPANARPER
jgi:hypothetical protein